MKGVQKSLFLVIIVIFAIVVILIAGLAVFNYKPTSIGKGYINLCTTNPTSDNFWENHNAEMFANPGDVIPSYEFASCDNLTVTIWEKREVSDNTNLIKYSRVTLQTKDGNNHDGWIPTQEIIMDNLHHF
jgi:hypothetical protein